MWIVSFTLNTNLLAQNYSGGPEIEDDPYYITNKTVLKYLSENSDDWSKHFKQTASLTFEFRDFANGGDCYSGVALKHTTMRNGKGDNENE